jgi:hypothetical protein
MRYDNKLCNEKMTFQECELAILRNAVDKSEKNQGQQVAMNEDVKKIIKILEDYLKVKKVICYGGTAINNILPKDAQFYNKDLEVPDYDFYSPNAMDDAIELANLYTDAGYTEVEAKAGVHHGTYKVYVNYLGVADITQLDDPIFTELNKDSLRFGGIRYASPDFLRMGMYLELSRPNGDVSRWEKVHKRLNLLNKYYQLRSNSGCNNVEFQRKMNRDKRHPVIKNKDKTIEEIEEEIFTIVRDELISSGAVFFGGYACSLYSKYVKDNKHMVAKIPDFDVLIENPEREALLIKQQLEQAGYTQIELIEHAAIGEIVPKHIEIRMGKESIVFLYEPIACHNYNIIKLNASQEIRVATIDTILSFYLAFLYAQKAYYYKDRLFCIAEFLFDVQEKNRLSQRGLLERFSLSCFGKQPMLEDIRAKKAEKFVELANKKNTREYDAWFLNYKPSTATKKKVPLYGKMQTINSREIVKSSAAAAAATAAITSSIKPTKKLRKKTVKKRKRKTNLFLI